MTWLLRAVAPWLRLAVGRAPAPDLGALAAAQHALAVDVGDHVAVAAEQRLGRAHLGAGRQLALGQAVAAVLLELGLASCPPPGRRRRTCTCPSCRAGRRRRPAGTAARRTGRRRSSSRSRCTGPCRAAPRRRRSGRSSPPGTPPCRARPSSACRRPRSTSLAEHAVVDRHHAAPVHAPGHLVLVLAGGDAAVALDAALGVAQEFHSGHVCLLRCSRYAFATWQSVVLVSCIMVTAVVAVGGGGVDRLAAHDRAPRPPGSTSACPRPATSRRSGTG